MWFPRQGVFLFEWRFWQGFNLRFPRLVFGSDRIRKADPWIKSWHNSIVNNWCALHCIHQMLPTEPFLSLSLSLSFSLSLFTPLCHWNSSRGRNYFLKVPDQTFLGSWRKKKRNFFLPLSVFFCNFIAFCILNFYCNKNPSSKML